MLSRTALDGQVSGVEESEAGAGGAKSTQEGGKPSASSQRETLGNMAAGRR